jgi:hypothetical protein
MFDHSKKSPFNLQKVIAYQNNLQKNPLKFSLALITKIKINYAGF